MTKKIYNNPAIEVVYMKKNDIVTLSTSEIEYNNEEILAPGRRDFNDFDSY